MLGLIRKLKANVLTLGSWIMIDSEIVAEVMARGFDWLTIDFEHSAIDLGKAQRLVRTIELNGCVTAKVIREQCRF